MSNSKKNDHSSIRVTVEGVLIFKGVPEGFEFKIIPDYGVDLIFSRSEAKYVFYDDDGDVAFSVSSCDGTHLCTVALDSNPLNSTYSANIQAVSPSYNVSIKKIFKATYEVDIQKKCD